VSQAGTALTLGPVAAAASPGSLSAVLRLSTTVNGTKADVPLTVNLNRDERRLLPSTWGVGLAASPTGNVLSRQITMRMNFGADAGWTAQSDSAWLSVTPSGSTNGSPTLTVTADPSGLADGSISVATVTVSSTESGVAPAVVRVGMWKSSVGAAATTSVPVPELNHNFVADPIRPLFYATTFQTRDVEIWNAYTGTRVAVIPNVGQGALGWSDISPDGRTLYVVDSGVVRMVDLDTRTVAGSFPLQAPFAPSPHVARVNGHDIVFSEGIAYESGRVLGTLNYQGESMAAAATRDGRKLFVIDQGAAASEFTLDYSAMAGGTLFASRVVAPTAVGSGVPGYETLGTAGDNMLALSVYHGCALLDPRDFSVVATLAATDIQNDASLSVTADGRVVCGGRVAVGAGVRVFSSTGQFIGGVDLADAAIQNVSGILVTTPDGLIAGTSTWNPSVVFFTLPH